MNDGIVQIVILVIIAGYAIAVTACCIRMARQRNKQEKADAQPVKNEKKSSLEKTEETGIYSSQLLSSMSHDIRTPMNAIMGFATLLSHDAHDSVKVQEYAQKIITSSRHMLRLIDEALDMSQIESGNITLREKEVSLHELVEEMTCALRPQLKEKGHTFHMHMEQVQHDVVIVDAVRLKQIWMNLLSNAVKYSTYGKRVDFEIIEIPQMGHTALYQFIVRDHGQNLPKEFQEHISITKKLVEVMDGSVRIEREQGVGNTYIVELTIPYGQQRTQSQSAMSLERDVFKNKHILIAEDNAMNAEILVELLKLVGASCETYENGRQVLEAFEKSQVGMYDLILMDVSMPVMDGYEAARAIRACEHPMAKKIPIIAMTANALAEDIEESLASGMNAHLAKPVEMSVLGRCVQKVLRETMEDA